MLFDYNILLIISFGIITSIFGAIIFIGLNSYNASLKSETEFNKLETSFRNESSFITDSVIQHMKVQRDSFENQRKLSAILIMIMTFLTVATYILVIYYGTKNNFQNWENILATGSYPAIMSFVTYTFFKLISSIKKSEQKYFDEMNDSLNKNSNTLIQKQLIQEGKEAIALIKDESIKQTQLMKLSDKINELIQIDKEYVES
jgi:hypothetical protein